MNDEKMNANAPEEKPAENAMRLRDLLISRVIDGSASGDDWSSFRVMAANDAEVWTDLSRAQREYEALNEAMNAAANVADGIDLPVGSGSPMAFESRVSTATRWGGWAVAAVLMLGWFTGSFSTNLSQTSLQTKAGSGATSLNAANMIPGSGIWLQQASPEEAFGQYLNAGQSNGQVVGEMPDPIVVETKPLVDGTIEVIFIRQIIERRVLDRAYRESIDEFGNPVAIPVDLGTLHRLHEARAF